MKSTLRVTAFLLALVLLAPLLLASCGGGERREVVAVSIPPVAALVRQISGDDFTILTMVPPGYSPEAYEPSVRTMMEFSDARLFFSIGMPVDEATLIPSLSEDTRHVSLSAVSAAAYPDLTIDGARDPHIWLSPRRIIAMLTVITEELAALRPDRAGVYREAAAAFTEALLAADARIRRAIAESGTTEFIVYHPAFGYLADEYGLTVHALEEHGREATAARLAEMLDYARDRGIKVIFYQAETDSRQAETFAAELGGRAVRLEPLSENYIKNLESMAAAIAGTKGETSESRN